MGKARRGGGVDEKGEKVGCHYLADGLKIKRNLFGVNSTTKYYFPHFEL